MTFVDFEIGILHPENVADEAATAAQLSGIDSHETQLKVLSIVDNPQEELEKIEEENAQSLDIYGDLIGGDTDGTKEKTE